MSVKRPSLTIEPRLAEHAVQLRREGQTFRQISAALRISKDALGRIFAAAPELHGAVGQSALTAEDAELVEDFRAVVKEAIGAIRIYARQLRKAARKGDLDPKRLLALTKAMETAFRLERLLRGQPTSHAKSERVSAPAETPAEREIRERMERLMTAGKLQ